MANIQYKRPSKGIKCIGVTWTDGKTTTNELIYHIMKKAWFKVGIISTISIDVWNWKTDNTSKMTSLTHFVFNKYMAQAKQNGIEYMIVEPSSHALFQYRIWPSKFIAVGFTNLTHEHLDFHGTMDKYFDAKAELFYKHLLPNSIWIFPKDFHYRDKLKDVSKVDTLLSFSQHKEAWIYTENIEEKPEIQADVCIRNTEETKCREWLFHFKSKLVGKFNIDNVLIAIAICRHIWVSDQKIVQWLETASNPAWRLDVIKTKEDITVIVDFALTPHALTTLYKSFKDIDFNTQIAVFGATGSRDKKKRPVMGELATQLNDFVIITEDENYVENGADIIEDIVAGIPEERNNYKVVQDRRNAINTALKMAEKDDVILLTGMGNFTSRTMWKKKIPRNDKAVVLEEIKKLGMNIAS